MTKREFTYTVMYVPFTRKGFESFLNHLEANLSASKTKHSTFVVRVEARKR